MRQGISEIQKLLVTPITFIPLLDSGHIFPGCHVTISVGFHSV